MTAQEWIHRYVAQVGSLLPTKDRVDVELEIRSLIQDELEARMQGRPADEQTALVVIQQFGSPQQIAARYGAQQHLIGPRLYPTFLTVLGIVLAVSIAIYSFGVVIDVGARGAQPDLGEILGGFFNTIFQAAGILVLVFALIERFAGHELAKAKESWDARSLPSAEESDRVKWGETIANIAFTLVAIVVFNFYLDDLGRFYAQGSGWVSVPIFAQEFLRFVPWFTAIWVADALLSLVVLARGTWQPLTRLLQIMVKAASLVILIMLVLDGSVLAFPPAEIGMKVVLAIAIAATIVEILKMGWRLLSPGRSAPETIAPLTR